MMHDRTVEAVTLPVQLLAPQRSKPITRAIVLTESMLLKTDEDWHAAKHRLRLQILMWICPGNARVRGNERAGRPASTANITSGLQLGRVEELRGLRNFQNRDRPEHHSTYHLKKRRVEKGSGRHFTLRSRDPSVFNWTNRHRLEGSLWDTTERGRSACGLFQAL